MVNNNAGIKGQLISRPFRVSTTGTLPAGLTANTIYFASTDSYGKALNITP